MTSTGDVPTNKPKELIVKITDKKAAPVKATPTFPCSFGCGFVCMRASGLAAHEAAHKRRHRELSDLKRPNPMKFFGPKEAERDVFEGSSSV